MQPMPRPRPPHLHRTVTRHKKIAWYVHVPGRKRVRIRAEFGSPEFAEEYAAAVDPNRPAPVGKPPKKSKTSFVVSPVFDDVPPGLMTSDRGSEVYFLRCGDRIKIGFSQNVRRRMTELRSGSADDPVLLFTVPGARPLEEYFHKRFEYEHVRREWFSYDGAVKAFIEGVPFVREDDDEWSL